MKIKVKSFIRLNVFFVVTMACSLPLASQTYTGGGGPIADDGSDNYYPITVSGLSPAFIDTLFGLETVCVNLVHTWDDDLVISLIAPDGTEALLSSRHGWDGDNYTNTCFNNDSPDHISLGTAPFTGTFKPDGSLAPVNNGQNANGIWRLRIRDTYPFLDSGTLLNWSLTFGNQPAKPFPFSGTLLPLVVITTPGGLIPNDPKVMVEMKVIHHGNGISNQIQDIGNIYTGLAGIELRGNSSQMMPKKSYGFETRNADSSDRNVILLGMPSESDWVLLANYADKSLMRNFFSYHMFRKTGRWAPRMRYCELVIDGEYQGIYLLGEKVKRDQYRVDISSLSASDSLLPVVSGGYLFKIDWIKAGDMVWESDYPAIGATLPLTYILEYPKAEDVTTAQIKYIRSVVDSFEYVMKQPDYADPVTGYRKYIDETSFIDLILLIEFTKNVDGYRLSTFLHKERNGKICAGPPWDYDLSWGNADYMDCWSTEGWSLTSQMDETDQCPFWWELLWLDTTFTNQMRCRWESLRQTIYNPSVILHEIDSVAAMLDPAVDLNFIKWPILGIYVWPNPAPIPTDYEGEVQKLKDWVIDRIAWMDANLPGYCFEPGIDEGLDDATAVRVYPNPARDRFGITGFHPSGTCHYEILDATGRMIQSGTWQEGMVIETEPSTAAGTYLLMLSDDEKSVRLRLSISR